MNGTKGTVDKHSCRCGMARNRELAQPPSHYGPRANLEQLGPRQTAARKNTSHLRVARLPDILKDRSCCSKG